MEKHQIHSCFPKSVFFVFTSTEIMQLNRNQIVYNDLIVIMS